LDLGSDCEQEDEVGLGLATRFGVLDPFDTLIFPVRTLGVSICATLLMSEYKLMMISLSKSLRA